MRPMLLRAVLLLLVGMLATWPVVAQFTVLDQAQDGVPGETEPLPVCGTQPVSIARMVWPSAELLAEIHARLLAQQYGCETSVSPGDLAVTASSMSSNGQPAVAPEFWVTRAAEVWNTGTAAQAFRPAAPTYTESVFEGWFIPDYVAASQPGLVSAADLVQALPALGANKLRFISCPVDWACALINRNLIRAFGLTDMVELVEPANRFEMDTLIAEAVSRTEPILFYYWQPNAVLSQFNFVALDMGAYDENAAKCLARVDCATPVPSAFADETVVMVLAEWVFTDIPVIAAYFQRAGMPLAEMNALLAQLSEPGATVEGIADGFVAERQDIWGKWIGSTAP